MKLKTFTAAITLALLTGCTNYGDIKNDLYKSYPEECFKHEIDDTIEMNNDRIIILMTTLEGCKTRAFIKEALKKSK